MVYLWQRKSLHNQWEAKEKSRARFLLSPSRECIQAPNSLPMGLVCERSHHFLIVPPTVNQTFSTCACGGQLTMTRNHFILLNPMLWTLLSFLTLNLSAERYKFPVNPIFCWVQTVPFFSSTSPIKSVWHSQAETSRAVLALESWHLESADLSVHLVTAGSRLGMGSVS